MRNEADRRSKRSERKRRKVDRKEGEKLLKSKLKIGKL